MKISNAIKTTLLLLALSMIAACQVPTTEGKQGNLGFNYDVHEPLLAGINIFGVDTADRPIAVGARAQLQAYEAGTNVLASITSATSAQPSIADIGAVAGSYVTIVGTGAGVAEVTVETTSGTDTVDITIAEVAREELLGAAFFLTAEDPANDLGEAGFVTAKAVFVGSTAQYFVRRYDALDQALIGDGLPMPALTATPAGVATMAEASNGDVLVTFDAVGEVDVVGTLTVAGHWTVVDASAVANFAFANIVGQDYADAQLSLGPETTTLVALMARLADDRPIGGVEAVAELSSSDATVCTAVLGSAGSEHFANIVEVQTLDAGTCTLTATLGSHTATLEVVVEANDSANQG